MQALQASGTNRPSSSSYVYTFEILDDTLRYATPKALDERYLVEHSLTYAYSHAAKRARYERPA